MKVAAIQHDIVWKDPVATCQRLDPMIRRAADDGARLVVLTEMYSTGFSLHADQIAEPFDGPSVSFLRESARSFGCTVIGTVPIRGDDGLARNVAVVARPDGSTEQFAKLHPFTFDRENEQFTPGDTPLTVDVDGLRVSVFICYDLRFGPSMWACAPATDCYVVPANWPATRRAHWSNLLIARAIENQAWVVGVNRVGTNRAGVEFSGDSAIVSPLGEVIATATRAESILLTDIDAAAVAEVRERFPFLADRRNDLGE